MTTFIKESNNQIHVGPIPRGSAKMDPYTKAALKFDDTNQIQKTVKRQATVNKFLCTGQGRKIARSIVDHIYGAPIQVNSMTEWEKEYCKRDVADTFKCYDNLFLKERLNDSVNKEIARRFGKDGKQK